MNKAMLSVIIFGKEGNSKGKISFVKITSYTYSNYPNTSFGRWSAPSHEMKRIDAPIPL